MVWRAFLFADETQLRKPLLHESLLQKNKCCKKSAERDAVSPEPAFVRRSFSGFASILFRRLFRQDGQQADAVDTAGKLIGALLDRS
jgi:hypothetical protein